MPGQLTSGKVGVWLASAPTGAELMYHEGSLARDRVVPKVGQNWYATTQLDETATTLWNAAAMGYVELTQRRVAEGKYQYLARLRRRRVRHDG